MIAALTPTLMDGTVVRWYADPAGTIQLASASRNKVEYYADEVPTDVRDAAQAAHRELARNRDADVRHYATHRREGPIFQPTLVPIGKEA